MSLSRAFTTRKARMAVDGHETNKVPHRSNTISKSSQAMRPQISAPLQLIHTTNMLSYNAPDLPRSVRRNSVNTNTTKSDDDSTSHSTAGSSPPTSPDMTPSERCPSPGGTNAAGYFMKSSNNQRLPVPETIEEQQSSVPAIPKRSPSHTKKNSYNAIARQRSLRSSDASSLSSSTGHRSDSVSRSSSKSTLASSVADIASNDLPCSKPANLSSEAPVDIETFQRVMEKAPRREKLHPFGQELAQVSELAEEFSKTQLKTIHEDDHYMRSRSLCKWSPSEYLGEISSLYNSFFPEALKPASAPIWI